MIGFEASLVQVVPAGLFTVAGVTIAYLALRGAGRDPVADETLLKKAHQAVDRTRLSNVLRERDGRN